MAEQVTQELVRKMFEYRDGKLVRRITRSQRNKVGDEAGTLEKSGYKRFSIDGKHYRVHRIVWLYHYGEFPDGQIDHINHDRTDNRIENLEMKSNLANARNQRVRKNNTSGALGVTWFKRDKKWRAAIQVLSKNIHLGYFDTIEEAISMRLTANDHYGFHPNHGGGVG